MSARHLETGEKGERAAEDYLRAHGYRVVERNWRCRSGELDLICDQGGTIVFVEVKTRTNGAMADPCGAVNRAKKARLSRAAGEYLTIHDAWGRPCRFDMVSVLNGTNGDAPDIEHLENAFELTHSGLGACPWQPW
ncbi:putative endonuclease [Desulfobaculum xiamenense]|uniref:UPF0102 protein GGQ74_002278 n=1 Tax=Desulfobaculum xiamenense TaxID=995050 RepID=A0A846QT20_9BACT|nr:putative endonuclease [Desulfobaculum xiamenense]